MYLRKKKVLAHDSHVPFPNQSSPGDDSNLLIALRKGTRSCTQHPITQYVCYDILSPFRAFTTSLSSVSIPTSVSQALSQPKWRATMEEKMKALE